MAALTISRGARRLRHLLVLLLAAASLALQAQTLTVPRESAVKAAFLMKFGTFVDWPPGAFARPEDPLVIGVIGDDAVLADLERLAQGRSINGHPIAVRRLREPPAERERLHILFLASPNESRLRDLIARTPGQVLVVTQLEGALSLGAVLNFVVEGGRVRFEAAPRAADSRGIKLSSRLLAVAKSVEERSQ
ncbi:YfiR family protein [Ramlibacter sp.]|uniref:YfiR family protein n=1 Tax=Ramlibacter sp. TaxID=1917967 RepID=UPI002CD7D3BC|nr:YfiR family protein [Ramlibacter sp.]HWI84600.1 YfiR family protein [Ramlibacter sp.]